MIIRLLFLLILYIPITASFVYAEDGYRLWLRYDKISDENLRKSYQDQIKQVFIDGESKISSTARIELIDGLSQMLGQKIEEAKTEGKTPGIIAGIWQESSIIKKWISEKEAEKIKSEGFLILKKANSKQIIITGKDDRGVLYGVFRFLQMLQKRESIAEIYLLENPKIDLRILNHWDNLDRTVERGYAGFSIWNWHQLPEYLDPRYRDYARANASIGINGSVVTNVNANALIFRADYLEKVAALANIFREYGIRIYLTARFSAPIDQGGLKTADPLDENVQKWWKDKVDEIYKLIPDFGGFFGQSQFGRTTRTAKLWQKSC